MRSTGHRVEKTTFDDIFYFLRQQAEEGVDFFTIHAGILKKALTMLKRKKRVGGIVSRGGAILARWMLANKKENPFYENFVKILLYISITAVALFLIELPPPSITLLNRNVL